MVNYLTFPGTNFPFISKNDSFAQMLLSDEEMEPVADVSHQNFSEGQM